MKFDDAKELYDQLNDLITNGFDDLTNFVEAIDTEVSHGVSGPKKDQTEDGEVLEEVTDEVTTSFDEIQNELRNLTLKLTEIREAIRKAI